MTAYVMAPTPPEIADHIEKWEAMKAAGVGGLRVWPRNRQDPRAPTRSAPGVTASTGADRWSDEVVEAAAEAMFHYWYPSSPWDSGTPIVEQYRDQARAALGVIPPDPCPNLVTDRSGRGPYCALAEHDADLLAAIREIVDEDPPRVDANHLAAALKAHDAVRFHRIARLLADGGGT